MVTATALYTPAVLALATALADYPLTGSDSGLPLRAETRSATCGSSLALGLAVDGDGSVVRVGARVQACAIGQAAAALFLEAARGRTGAEIAQSEQVLSAWLAGQGAMPDWPGLSALAAAREYPARHGAILLAWRAARAALCSAPQDR